MLDRLGVVAEHGAFAHAKAAVLGDDHAARLERLGGGGHDVAAVREIEIGVPYVELFDEVIDGRMADAKSAVGSTL